MLKMKLPQRKSNHSASDDEDDEEEEQQQQCAARPGMCSLQREAVYEWFVQALGPAQRLEFACGLLDLCNPLELRFLGACLEDLARKDFHYLRDCESRANGLSAEPEAALQQLLGDLRERTARSRLIVYLALLGSENRDVADRFHRLLLLPDTEAEEERGAGREELLLLFTMASLHPAFSFHQRVTLRERLGRLREAMCAKSSSDQGTMHEYLPSHEKRVVDGNVATHNGVIASSHSLQQEAVHIENITFKYVQRARVEKNPEYTFEVIWSDKSKTSVKKSNRELVEFLLTLPKELSNEQIDKTILDALQRGKRREEHPDLEPLWYCLVQTGGGSVLKEKSTFVDFYKICQRQLEYPSYLTADHRPAALVSEDGNYASMFWLTEPTLEVGSGHETCGETSSESYSSPPSPHHNGRGSFESEEERDRDTDSNSEESTKPASVFPKFGGVNASPTKASDHPSKNDESTRKDSLSNPNFPQFSIVPTLHCVVPANIEKLESGLAPPLPTEGKTLGMLVGPVSVPPVRDIFHQGSHGIVSSSVSPAIDSDKSIDLLTSMAVTPSTFLPRNCSPSSPALQAPVHRLKVPTQGLAETCSGNGSAQTALGLNSASAGFFSIHNQGSFVAPHSTVSDALSKSLNQVVPHLDANTGAISPATNVKLVLPGTNLSPAPSAVPYPLSGPSLPSGVLPTAHSSVLNAAGSAAPQPTINGISQVQPAVPLTVPTHSPCTTPSPSPALTHSTAQSDSTSFISAAVGNNSTNGTILQSQQIGPGACGSCGRRCGCGVPMGSYYYPSPITGQMYTRVPFPFPIPSICNSTYLNQAHQSNGTHYPVFLPQPPYTNGLMHDPVLGSQANYGMQQVAGFPRLYPVYPATNVVGNANGSVAKKNGNVSCFNCGVTGHYAQDCKQPPMEASQQGTFRLRYVPLPNPSDSADCRQSTSDGDLEDVTSYPVDAEFASAVMLTATV
ncbi:zinc finger CCHC domain-containing protein 2 [Gastrophryne carolinensis]